MQTYQALYKLLTPTFFFLVKFHVILLTTETGRTFLKHTSTALYLCISPYPLQPLQNLVTYQSR